MNSHTYFPSYYTLKQEERSPLPQKFAMNVFSGLQLQFQQGFSDHHYKEIPILQNPFNLATEELQPHL